MRGPRLGGAGVGFWLRFHRGGTQTGLPAARVDLSALGATATQIQSIPIKGPGLEPCRLGCCCGVDLTAPGPSDAAVECAARHVPAAVLRKALGPVLLSVGKAVLCSSLQVSRSAEPPGRCGAYMCYRLPFSGRTLCGVLSSTTFWYKHGRWSCVAFIQPVSSQVGVVTSAAPVR